MSADLTLDIPLGRLHALRLGTPGALPVLALHGWLDNAASFVPLARHLRGLDLVALDLPGHGRSAHLPVGAEYSLATTFHAVLDAADALGWPRFALLGHSMGAAMASLLAGACPERVTRLVAIEALGALADTPERTTARLREALAAQRALRAKSLRVFPDLDTAIAARMHVNGLSAPVARLLVERGTRRSDDGRGWVWSSDPRLTTPTAFRLTEAQIGDVLAHIECPTLALFADPPPAYFSDALRRERFARLRHGELVVLDGSHHLHMEQPEAVAAAIDGFLRAPAAASAA
ncbi:MAG TPA: alpha/beta hydrolase [Lysobacter sp.]|nr:alpha/beta hydrolase [Lysobacter sp.]